jgi:hypothetical protein
MNLIQLSAMTVIEDVLEMGLGEIAMRTTIDNRNTVPAPAGPYSHAARIDAMAARCFFVGAGCS